MSLPLIVSFFTDDWTYPEHGKRLKYECDALGLDSHIVRRESAGGYLENTCQKPAFIAECLARFARPVLWLDVDATIVRAPEFFAETGFDFQARLMPANRRRTWHVGTMYWAPSARAKAFVAAWADRTGQMTDESSLEQTWRELGPRLKSRDIPAEYFEIPARGESPSPECVIMHRLSEGPSKRASCERANWYERHII